MRSPQGAPTSAAEVVSEQLVSRITLKHHPRLQLAGRIHAYIVLAFTPLAAASIIAWGISFGVGFAELATVALAHMVGFLAVAVALHRYFSHRAFEVSARWRAALAILAMTAAQGSVSFWVSDHRRHHRFSDAAGDPHSPVWPEGAFLARLWHAHGGWMLNHEYANPALFAPDIISDRPLMALNRLYPVWVLAGLLAPALIGAAIGGLTGSVAHGAALGFIWGGVVRVATVHQATFAVNSLAHAFGKRRFTTSDRSQNLGWLMIPTLGDSFHNNHHAHPSSARAGLAPGEVDLAFAFIRCLERFGVAKNLRLPNGPPPASDPLEPEKETTNDNG